MTKVADVTHPWDGDVNEAVVEEWKDETTAFERIVSVIDVTTEPAFASEIAERAVVSEPTVRKHLQSLASVGRVDTLDDKVPGVQRALQQPLFGRGAQCCLYPGRRRSRLVTLHHAAAHPLGYAGLWW